MHRRAACWHSDVKGKGKGGREDEENGKRDEKRRETRNVCKKHYPRDVTMDALHLQHAGLVTSIVMMPDECASTKTEKQLRCANVSFLSGFNGQLYQ